MPDIKAQTRLAIEELLQNAYELLPGDIVVVGCSTSEVVGECIGSHSSLEVADKILTELMDACKQKNLYLAVQCCEHLNRALVVERDCMQKYDLPQVSVIPWIKAGGAMATLAMERFADPVVVETLNSKGKAGIDIGGTFIGMHLKPVVVPIHTSNRHIGEAYVTMAHTRPKYIGGQRAKYPEVKKAH